MPKHGKSPAAEASGGPASATDAADRLHYVKGNAAQASYGKGRKIVTHIVNTMGRWGKGFVLALTNRFGKEVGRKYRAWHKCGGGGGNPKFELGAVQVVEVDRLISVANMVAQTGIKTGSRGPPIEYEALAETLSTVGALAEAEGASVHMPRIGTGLAGGTWGEVEPLILAVLQEHLGLHVYVYTLSGDQ